MKNFKNKKGGFTLIEILVVIGIIAILAAIVIIAINPARQFAQARNTQRTANVNAILNSIGQRIADNKGIFQGTVVSGSDCPNLTTTGTGALTAGITYSIYSDTAADSITATGGHISLNCVVPTYIPALPNDPTLLSTSTDTGYTVSVNTIGRVKVCAPLSVETALGSPAEICVTR